MSSTLSRSAVTKPDNPANTEDTVATTLPEELKLPEKGSVLSLVPALKETTDNLEAHATTASQSLAKLEEILQAFRKIEAHDNPAHGAAGATIKVQLPEHPNTAEINCGVVETDPVVAVTYSPGRSFIPLIQSECPTRLSATLKSFNGKRDVKFSDLVLSNDGTLEIAPLSADELLKRVAAWIKGITSVIHQDMELRTKRLGYDGGNEHFEGQLLDSVVQILCIPHLEFIYQDHESEEKIEARKKREALIEGAHQVTLEALENVRREIGDIANTIDSLAVETLRAEYLAKLEEKFDTACKKVKPEALKHAEERLAQINEEIAKKEAKIKSSTSAVDPVQATANLFQFLDSAVKSHSKLGSGESIEAQHKMKWAKQLCGALQSPLRKIGYEDLTSVVKAILDVTWMYANIDGATYAKRSDIDRTVTLAISTVRGLDSIQVASVLQTIKKIRDSKSRVTIDDISSTLSTLCNTKAS